VNTTLKKFLINSFTMYLNQGLIVCLSLFVSLKVIGHLGPLNFGIYSTVIAFVSLFSFFTTGSGIDAVIISESASGKIKAISRDVYLSTGIILRVVLGFLSSVVAIVVAGTLYSDSTTFWFIVLFSTSLIFSFDPRRSILNLEFIVQDRRLLSELVILSVTVLALGTKYYLVLIGSPLFPFIIVQLLQVLILSLTFLGIAIALKHFHVKFEHFSWVTGKELLKKSIPLAGSSLLVMVYMRIDQIMLSKMLGMESVGIYSVAVRIVESINFLPTIAAALLLPIISRNAGTKKIPVLLSIAFRMAAWAALLFVVFFWLFSRDILFFLWGDQYLASVAPLKILVWSQVLVFVSCMHGPVLISQNLQRYIPLFTGITAIINVLLNLLLIPRFGPSGAAIATLGAYSTGYFLIWFFKELWFIARPTWTQVGPLVLIVAILLLKIPGLPAPSLLFVISAMAIITLVIGGWSFHQLRSLSSDTVKGNA